MKSIKHGVPQGSVLGPLLFIIYINDIFEAIIHSSTFLFADDTGLLNSNCNLKTIEEQVNEDLQSLYKWLCASKISLNITKTEVVLFYHNHKKVNYEMKLVLNDEDLKISKNVKYLGLLLDHDLSFSSHLEFLSIKLRNANGAISKIRHVANESVCKSVFNALFTSYISYACQTWAQCINLNTSRIFKLQKTALRLLTFSDFRSPSQPLFYRLKLLKISDLVKLRNITLVHEILNAKSPIDVSNTFNLKHYSAYHDTRGKTLRLIAKPKCRTTRFGINSIIYQCISNWNELQQHYKNINLSKTSHLKLSKLAFQFLIQQYLT